MSETSEEDFVDANDSLPSPPPLGQSSNDCVYYENEPYPLHRAVFENRSVSVLHDILFGTDGRSSVLDDENSVNSSSTINSLHHHKNKQQIPKEPKMDIGQKDPHGNTALHLAVMLGQKDHINFLLKHNSPIKSRNCQGWTPLDEAISYGDRKIITTILRTGRKQARQSMNQRKPKLIETLSCIKDFQMRLKWEFYSWIPLVKRFLPSDVCRIAKKGSNIRLDTTLCDYNDRRWQRGDITLLFVGGQRNPSVEIPSERPTSSSSSTDSLVIMDNELKVYQYLHHNDAMDINEDIDLLMSSDLIYPQMSTKSITFTRTQTGWFFARYNKTEKVGQYEADFYNINGLTIETKKRREHLTDEDVQSNKALYQSLKKSLDARKLSHNSQRCEQIDSFDDLSSDQAESSLKMKNGEMNGEIFHGDQSLDEDEDIMLVHSDDDEDDDNSMIDVENDDLAEVKAAMVSATNGLIKRRKSLPPPQKPTNITWNDYIQAPKGNPPCLGRQWKIKENSRTFKATVAMSQEFPLTIESLLNILEVITQFKHFKKLKEFVNLNLPPGFPVKIDIPLIATILARVTFLNFAFNDQLDDQLFEIPADYTEDPNRFPDF